MPSGSDVVRVNILGAGISVNRKSSAEHRRLRFTIHALRFTLYDLRLLRNKIYVCTITKSTAESSHSFA